MKKPAIYLAAAALTLGTGVAGAVAATHSATSPTASLHNRIATLEAHAAAAHQTKLVAALQKMDASMQRANMSKADRPQPQSSPTCPPSSKNPGNPPACGKDHNGSTPPSPPAPAACGPQDQGGSAATGPVSSQVYGIGVQISNGGGAPLGDAVQSIACAVDNLTGGQL
ncbi:MAG TPA: hypothetical protein VFT62_10195 [Mycobacteriales bacterium]|nr:hypothetical protein [Mycobacteriales bacterium]